jgi:betaine-aldehyde dehydrogenase
MCVVRRAQCANGNASDVDSAVSAARAAFDADNGWADTTGAKRAEYLKKLDALVTAHKARLAALETLNSGKPLKEAEWDMDDVAGCFTYYAAAAEELDTKQNSPIKLGDTRFKCTPLMRFVVARPLRLRRAER